MGLSVDIERIYTDNCAKQGIRKCGFLVNQLGKLTREDKKVLIEQNRVKYGLSQEQIDGIRLPAAQYLVEIYDVLKITNPKSRMSVVEKINHLIKLEKALLNKLELMKTKQIKSTGGGKRSASSFRLPGKVKLAPAPGLTPKNQDTIGSEIEDADEEDEQLVESSHNDCNGEEADCEMSATGTPVKSFLKATSGQSPQDHSGSTSATTLDPLTNTSFPTDPAATTATGTGSGSEVEYESEEALQKLCSSKRQKRRVIE